MVRLNQLVSGLSEVQGLSTTAGDQQVQLSWSEPAGDGGSPITRYQYRVSADGGDTWYPDWTDVPDGPDSDTSQANETSYTVTDLSNGTEYTFEVRAVNALGNGESTSVTETPETALRIVENGVTITSVPAAHSDYVAGEVITIRVTFNEAITVTGTPELQLEFLGEGGRTQCAADTSRNNSLECAYTVTTGDHEEHGIRIRANSLTLPPGTTITAQADPSVNATLSHEELRRQTGHRVNRQPFIPTPVSEHVRVTSTPKAAPGIYGLDEKIEITVTYSKAVEVIKSPGVEFLMGTGDGGATRTALYKGGSLTQHIRFEYTVRSGDRDSDGITIEENSVNRGPGDRITDAVRQWSVATSLHDEIGQLPAHKTDGNLTVPAVSIADASAEEGESLSFTLTLSEATPGETTVDWSTRTSLGDTATADTDYTTASGTATFAANTTTTTISVATTEDLLDEADETFTVTLSNPIGRIILGDDTTATGTITDDDDAPFIAILDAIATEGEDLTFTASLSGPSGGDVSATWTATTDSTDTATETDLEAPLTGTLTIAAGERETSFTVGTVDDEVEEDDETFTVTLSSLEGVTLESSVTTARGTIEDNDDATAPTLGSAAINGQSLVLTYDEPLDEASVPAASAYTVNVDGTDVSLAATNPVAVSGSSVTLRTAAVVDPGATVTVSYTVPASGPVQDTTGNDAESLLSESVTNNTAAWPASEFITKWRTTTASEAIRITTGGSTAAYTVDWGDGSSPTSESGNATHTYAVAGTYTIRISGGFNRIRTYDDATNAAKLRTIEQWGDAAWTSMESAFRDATNMTYNASDTPDLSNATSMESAFRSAHAFNGAIGSWSVGTITTMKETFRDARAFNQPLNGWDTSNVIDMESTFQETRKFNQNLNEWDTSNVLTTETMFRDAEDFNGDISAWDVRNVNTMDGMFGGSEKNGRGLGPWYITLDDLEATANDRVVGTIRAQNDYLQNHDPGYRVSTATIFEIRDGQLLVREDAHISAGDYEVQIQAYGPRLFGPGGTVHQARVTVTYLDVIAPMLQKAEIEDEILTLTYDEVLDTSSVPATSAYTVNVNGTEAEFSNTNPVSIEEDTITLVLDTPVAASATITVSYEVPTTGSVKDTSGNEAAAFTTEMVDEKGEAERCPTPTPENQIWCGIMTVQANPGEGEYGGGEGVSRGYCLNGNNTTGDNFGALSEDEFETGETTYTVRCIRFGGRRFHFDVAPAPIESIYTGWRLHTGNEVWDINEAGRNTTNEWFWTRRGIPELGSTLAVRLTEKSNDSELSDLELSDGSGSAIELNPTFAAETTAYSANTAPDSGSVTITPTLSDDAAEYEILDGNDVEIEDADEVAEGHQVTAGEASNIIKVKVTAEDESTTTYTITLQRVEAGITLNVSPTTIAEMDDPVATGDQHVATVTGTIFPAPADDLTLEVSATPVAPATASQFLLSTNTTLTFAAGATESTGTVTITAVDDTEETGEKEVTVSAAPSDTSMDAPDSVILTITDDEGAAPTLESAKIDGQTLRLKYSEALDETSSPVATAYTVTVNGTDRTPIAAAVSGDVVRVILGTGVAAGDTVTVTYTPPATNPVRDLAGLEAAALDAYAVTNRTGMTPTLAFGNLAPRAEEGETITFTVELAPAADEVVTVDWSASSGTGYTATEDVDFTTASNTLTFAVGETSKTFTVETLEDALDEEDVEIFLVALSDVTGDAVIHTSNGATIGQIADDDASPTITVSAATGEEGAVITHTVTLSEASGREIRINRVVTGEVLEEDGHPAEPDKDHNRYDESNLIFEPGEVEKSIEVTTVEDALDEHDELYAVVLIGVSNISAEGSTLTTHGTIIDNDDPPSIGIADGDGAEGDGVTFTLTLSQVSGRDVEVSWTATIETGDSAALTDLSETTGTVTVTAGDASTEFTVPTVDNSTDEAEKTFTVTLSNPDWATLDTNATSARGTILNDDDTNVPVLQSAIVVEEILTLTYDERLDEDSVPATSAYTVKVNGTAVSLAASDPVQIEGTEVILTLAQAVASDATATVSYQKPGTDPVKDLSGNEAASFTDESVAVDPKPTFSLRPVTTIINEGESMTFAIELSPVSDTEVSVDWAVEADTSDGSTQRATAGKDFTAASGTLTFAAGVSERTFVVETLADELNEFRETFATRLSNATGGAEIHGTRGNGLVFINDDDDEEPVLSVSAEEVTEGETATHTIALSAPSGKTVTVKYRVTGASPDARASAHDGEDLNNVDATDVTFAPEETEKTFEVATIDDAIDEDTEVYIVRLSDVGNAGVTDDLVASQILDNDDPPTMSIADASGGEGEAITFTVTLSAASGWRSGARATWTASVETGDTADTSDLGTTRSGSVEVEEDALTGTFTVETVADALTEEDETFTVTLSSPVNATLDEGATTAKGTITDQDITAPVLTKARVSGTTITLEYDETLDTGSVPATSDYVVTVDGTAAALATGGVAISGSTVTLTLASAVSAGDEVKVTYTAPSTNAVRDIAENEAVGFTDQVLSHEAANPGPGIVEITSDLEDNTYSPFRIGSGIISPDQQPQPSTWDGIIKIKVVFDGPVMVTGPPTLSLNSGNTADVATYQSGSGTDTLTFHWTIPQGRDFDDLDVTGVNLAAGTISDSDGAADLALPVGRNLADNKSIHIDSTPPRLLGHIGTYSAAWSIDPSLEEIDGTGDTYWLRNKVYIWAQPAPNDRHAESWVTQILDEGIGCEAANLVSATNSGGGDGTDPNNNARHENVATTEHNGKTFCGSLADEYGNRTFVPIVIRGIDRDSPVLTVTNLSEEKTVSASAEDGNCGGLTGLKSRCSGIDTERFYALAIEGTATCDKAAYDAASGDLDDYAYTANEAVDVEIGEKICFRVHDLTNDTSHTQNDAYAGSEIREADTNAPTLVSATINGATVTLTYDEPLDENSVPDRSVYTATLTHVGGETSEIETTNTNPVVSGRTVSVNLEARILGVHTVTLNYTVPGSNPIQDEEGNDAPGFTDQPLTNENEVVPTLSLRIPNSTVDEGSTFEITVHLDPPSDTQISASWFRTFPSVPDAANAEDMEGAALGTVDVQRTRDAEDSQHQDQAGRTRRGGRKTKSAVRQRYTSRSRAPEPDDP